MTRSTAEQSNLFGRPNNTTQAVQRRPRLLAAALDELQVWSFERFSVESVADRAGVDTADVHRLWTSPQELIVDAIVDHAREVVCFPDTGCMRRDLAGHLASLAEYVNTPIGRALLRKGVIDPKLWAPADVRGHLWKAYANEARVIFERAERRDEIRPGIARDTVLQMAIGPVCLPALYGNDPIDTAQLCMQTADYVCQVIRRSGAG
jgi:hypothetical protein